MLQLNGEILNTPIGWLTTLATLSNKPANHKARYLRCGLTKIVMGKYVGHYEYVPVRFPIFPIAKYRIFSVI